MQDGEAHLPRGFSSFGAYAEHTFDGLTAANAKKISIQGAVLLVLERHERISLNDPASQLPGATGLRALATVLGQHGEDTMLTVYDKASQLRPGRAIVDSTVNLAVRGLLTPPPQLQVPAALPAGLGESSATGTGDRHVDERVDEDLDNEEPDEDPEAVHELHDRLIEIRRVLDDLGAVTSELAAVRGRKEAQRILCDLLEEIGELPDALAAAIASQHPDDPQTAKQ